MKKSSTGYLIAVLILMVCGWLQVVYPVGVLVPATATAVGAGTMQAKPVHAAVLQAAGTTHHLAPKLQAPTLDEEEEDKFAFAAGATKTSPVLVALLYAMAGALVLQRMGNSRDFLAIFAQASARGWYLLCRVIRL